MTEWLTKMSDHMTASGSTELSDFVDLSLSESEKEYSLPSTSCFVSHNVSLISESHFISILQNAIAVSII